MLNILKYKSRLMLAVTSAVLLTSCLKDKDYDDQVYGIKDQEGGEFVTIPKASRNNVLAIESVDEVQTINLFEVSYDFVNQAPGPITVTLVADHQKAVDKDPTTIIMPSSVYTLPSMTVTIESGKRLSESFAMQINTGSLDPTEVYAMAFTIASVNPSSIKLSSNLNTVMLYFTVKNRYDGEYTVTGTMVDAGSSTLTGYFPMKYYLITSGASTADGFDPVVWEDYFIPIRSGTALSGYGSFSPIFRFDADGNITEVTNAYGQPAGNGRYAELDPSGENMWDPTTKTIKVKFFMFQPASVPLPDPRVKFDWTMTYVGPRP